MMEGISHEAASLAGHLKLSNLIWIYDSNRVTIEGHTDLAYSDDVESRFRGYNWHTLHVDDANDTGLYITYPLQDYNRAWEPPAPGLAVRRCRRPCRCCTARMPHFYKYRRCRRVRSPTWSATRCGRMPMSLC